MPRIPYPDIHRLSEPIRIRMTEITPNGMRMLAGGSPAVFDGISGLGRAFVGHQFIGSSKLPADLREVAILRVAYLSNCRYEIYHHETLARDVGHSDEQIQAVKRGGASPGILNGAQQSVLDFTEDVVINVRAGDASLAAVRTYLSDETVIDLVFLIGLYMAVSRFLETTGVELDEAPLDWKKRDELHGWAS